MPSAENEESPPTAAQKGKYPFKKDLENPSLKQPQGKNPQCEMPLFTPPGLRGVSSAIPALQAHISGYGIPVPCSQGLQQRLSNYFKLTYLNKQCDP